MKLHLVRSLLAVAVLAATCAMPAAAASANRQIGINVLLNRSASPAVLSDIGRFGRVRDVFVSMNALTLQAAEGQLTTIRQLAYVAAANPDADRHGAPIDGVAATDFADGLSTWNLDGVNATDFGFDNRTVPQDGSGVFVAVLDTGLVDQWRRFFPEQRIATGFAISFGGGGGERGNVSSQPNKWEHDANSHGTHVTSTILGYALGGTPVNGVAPGATIIPVKVLNQNGSGWSSVVARGIEYVGQLKAGPLRDHPVVINMSLGGPVLDAVEAAAIDFAIAQGVVIVASAGNAGAAGMGYPGAYAPVISVAASGWVGEWTPGNRSWWWNQDVAEPTDPEEFYITDFSSRQLPGQDLDVAAPGSWVVGPYQLQNGHPTYYFLGGTSMASPHVAGIAALMLQKNPGLVAGDVESILEGTATPLAPGSRNIVEPSGAVSTVSWGADATGAGLVTADAALAATP